MDKVLDILNAKLLMANKHGEVIKEYKNLKTDEERVIFTLNIMIEYNIIPQSCGDIKDAKESEKLREQGNKIFVSTPLKNRNCLEAIKLYSKSIAYAPYPSEQLALAYANRSAVLIKVHKYEECIKDIDRALALNYPENLRAKIYLRKAECQVALKSSTLIETIKEAQNWLEKMSINETNKKIFNDKLTSIKTTSLPHYLKKNSPKYKSNATLPEIKFKNPILSSASDAVTIKYNELYGRHLVATRKLKPGEIIAIEKPYSLLLTPDNVHTHCSNCLEVCWANIPCNYCSYAMYCSEKCKANDWEKLHEVECTVFPILIKLDFLKLDLLSLRLAVQAVRGSNNIQELRTELKEVNECNDSLTRGFSKNGIFESDKYRSILSLITNTEKRSVQDLFRRSLDTCFILYFLASCSNMFGAPLNPDLSTLVKNEDVTFVGGLIMRHQQMIPSNGHSISEEYELECVERGIAAMPLLSLINHSCDPNTMRNSRSGCEVIYVMYPIEKDEQILDNYGMHYAISPKATRQQHLLKSYYFTCNCLPCRQDWPLLWNVPSIQQTVKDRRVLNKIAQALKKFNTYVDLATEGNVTDKPYIMDDLLNMIEVLYNNAQMPCAEMNNVVETLKRVYDLNGNKFEIPKL